ncbi:MAG: hypothetical protein WA014_02565 [Minisyncoccia bacterium]
MKKLLAALLLIAAPAFAQTNGWQEIQNGWGEIQTATGATSVPATCTTAGMVPIFLGSPVAMGCDAGLTYDAATDTLTTGTVAQGVGTAHTFRATAPATLTITGSTNATPIEVTAAAHGLVTGDNVSISGITGNTNANGYFKVTKTGANTFTLQNYSTGADIAGNGAHGGAPVGVAGIVQANYFLTTLLGSGGGFWFPDGGAISKASGQNYTFSGTNSITAYGVVSNGGIYYFTGDTPVSRGGAPATLQLGAANSAAGAAVAQALCVQSNITQSNVAAPASLKIAGPNGTGTGAVQGIELQTGAVQASGATAHVSTTRIGMKELHINLRLGDIAVYANNAAALAGGLVAGDLYRTGADPDPVMIVH